MIETLYAVNFLKGHLQRFIKFKRINATIDCGDNYVSFYVKDDNSSKQYLARGSNHHLRMQHLADKDEPWKGDNISIEFITPNSPQDSVVRGRVCQNHYGGIKPFDVTIYQYDNTILDERDLSQIFRSIISFLNGMGFTDPFAGTPKAAKVKPRTANIKPYKEPTRKARNISVDKDGNWVSANGWGADYVLENKQYNKNRNMKQTVKLRESELKKMIAESVRRVLNEATATMPHDDLLKGIDYDPWDDGYGVQDKSYHKEHPNYSLRDFANKLTELYVALEGLSLDTNMGKNYQYKLKKEFNKMDKIAQFIFKCERMGEGLPADGSHAWNMVQRDRNYSKLPQKR